MKKTAAVRAVSPKPKPKLRPAPIAATPEKTIPSASEMIKKRVATMKLDTSPSKTKSDFSNR